MKRRALPMALTVVVAAAVVIGGLTFSRFVQESLWQESVTDVLEVTSQGRHALDAYLGTDFNALDLFVAEAARVDGTDEEAIGAAIELFDRETDDSTYLTVDLASGRLYRTGDQAASNILDEDQVDALREMPESGILQPFLDEVTGVNSIAVYKKFTFADGTQAFARKARPVSTLVDEFSLSFYDNTGFSYVVNAQGDVLVRSMHSASNRTFANIFDIVDAQGNDEGVVASFEASLAKGQSGITLFAYGGEQYLFCYTPMESAEGWSLVSIIPNAVITEQADAVLRATAALCTVIAIGLLAVLLAFWLTGRAHHREIERMAYYDSLTGLYSSDKFKIEGNALLAAALEGLSTNESRSGGKGGQEGDRAPVAEGAQGGVAVAYFNISDFKLINDVDGYQRGDEILTSLGEVLADVARPGGIASRLSADHFLLAFPYRDAQEAVARCQAVVDRAHRLTAAGKQLSLHAGLCCSEDAPDATDVNELTDRARIAKTEGRHAGKELLRFSHTMRDQLLRRADLERSMESALENEEFFVVIQPKYSPDGQRVLGGEALVRWRRPGEGVVSPGEFVPLFEQNGFIIRLDEFVFERTCRYLRERLDAGEPVVPVSANVSRLHLHRPDFVETYARIKDRYRIPDGMAELEVTESIVLEDLGNARRVIAALQARGFSCSIDDFGSGESSLNALKDLPVDVLKLDRAFLFGHDQSLKEDVVVRTVIDMAGRLQMKTVMEGVETPEQLAFLQTTACDMIQGFVFSRPVSPEAFFRLVDGA